MAGKPKYDWKQLRDEFAANAPETLIAFAARKGIAYSAVRKRADEGKWEEARESFRARVSAEVTATKVKFKAREEAEIDARVHKVADDFTTIIQKRVEEEIAALKPGAAAGGGKGKGAKKTRQSALDLKLLLDGLDKAYALQRTSAGLTKQKTPERVVVEGSLEVATGVMEMPRLKDE